MRLLVWSSEMTYSVVNGMVNRTRP